MLALRRRAARAALLIAPALAVIAVLGTAPAATAAAAGRAARLAAGLTAAPGGGGCQEVFQPPHSWVVVCGNGSGTGGSPGHGGGGGKYTCTLHPAVQGADQLPRPARPAQGQEVGGHHLPG